MKNFIAVIFGKNEKKPRQASFSREEIEKKVKDGTEKAIREYGYVFRKLAEYDRS